MTECRFCMSVDSDGEPAQEVTTYVTHEDGRYTCREIYLCEMCRGTLRELGVDIRDGWGH